MNNIYLEILKIDDLGMLADNAKGKLDAAINSIETTDDAEMFKAYLHFKNGDHFAAISLLNNTVDAMNTIAGSTQAREIDHLLTSARTPSEVAAAVETASRLPILDYTFLIELKSKVNNKQGFFDQVAEKIIRNVLNTRNPLAVNYLAYDVAIRLHSKSRALEKRYGTRDQLVKKFMDKNSYDNSETCDDRELIDLCDKYCAK